MNEKKPLVLFLCTGNSVRSQMGEAFLKHYAGQHFTVHSAGLKPKGIHPLTIQVMDEVGLDIRGQQSNSVKDYMGHYLYRFVITVCSEADASCPRALWSNGTKLHWPFDDPAAFEGSDANKLARFRAVRDQIDQKIKVWLKELALEPA